MTRTHDCVAVKIVDSFVEFNIFDSMSNTGYVGR